MSSPLDRLFAGLYDTCLAGAESAGLAAWRRDLLGALTGDVLEIGAGTGLNLAHYPPGVRLVLSEPEPAMRAKLAQRSGDHVVSSGAAEALPFEDAQFDWVVSGLVLCSVGDLDLSLAEIKRVLKPGGGLVFIEHVASETAWIRGIQRAVEPVWKVAARGCHLTRDTTSALRDAGFTFELLQREAMPGGGLACIRGVARPIHMGSTPSGG